MVTTASVTITGRYTRGDRTPATGTVTIRPNVVPPIVRDTENRVILTGAVVARLDGAGAFTVEVPATDDPNLDPNGFTYTATVALDHLARTEEVPPVHFEAPAAAVALDLSTVSHKIRASPVYAQPATAAEVATITRLAGDAARLAGDAARVVDEVAATIDGVAAELPGLRQTVDETAGELAGRLSEAALTATIAADRAVTLPPTGAAGYLDAALPLRDTAPVVIGVTGCSHSLGSSASMQDAEWAARIAFMLRQAYPSLNDATIPTMRTLAQGVAALPLSPGLHVVNAAVGSTTAATFLTDATSDQLLSLKPSFIIMDGGFSNSYANGHTPATAKAQLEARIAYLKSRATAPFGILLLHWFDRKTGTPVAPWDEFGRAMQEIALADPDTCAFLDLANIGRLAGNAGADSFSIMAPDGTHTNNHGQEIAANVIAANALRLSRPPVIQPAPRVRHVQRLASDTFAGDSTALNGRTTDSGLGGAPATVECSGGTGMKTAGGALVRQAAGASQTYALPTANNPDVRVSIDVDEIAGGPFYLFARRLSTSGTSAWSYEVNISFDIVGGTKGMAALNKRVNGIASTLAAPVRFAKGDRIGLQCIGDRIGLLINGTVVAEVTDASYPSGSYAGVGTYANADFSLDDLALDSVSLSHPLRPYARSRFTSDAFTGGDAATLDARNTDATIGGTAKPWVTSPGGTQHIGIVGGRLARGTSGTPVAAITGAGANSEVSLRFVMAAPNEDGSIFLFNRRTGLSSSTASQYRVNVLGAKARLERTAGSATALPLSEWVSLAAGDRVGLACYGSTIDLTVNGNVAATAVDANVSAAGFAGMEIQNAVTAFSLDDLVIDNLAIA